MEVVDHDTDFQNLSHTTCQYRGTIYFILTEINASGICLTNNSWTTVIFFDFWFFLPNIKIASLRNGKIARVWLSKWLQRVLNSHPSGYSAFWIATQVVTARFE